MKMSRFKLTASYGLVLLFATHIAAAIETTKSPFVIEEITVTAQKREESLQDVAISIFAVGGEEIRAGTIDKLESLAPMVPTLHVAEGFANDQLFVRGFGSGNNFGFEQAVGQQIDGYFYGRSRFGRVQFLDIERLEVLKGPQGAIIGKNTTAGALNITTAKPTDEFEAWLSATVNFDNAEGEMVEGAVSGPLTEDLSGRLALRWEDRDGYVSNSVTGEEDQALEDYAGRVTLNWKATPKLNVLLQYAHGDLQRHGRNMEVSACSAAYIAFLGGGSQDCRVNGRRNALAPRNGVGNFEVQDSEFDTVGLTLTWQFDRFRVTSLSGYADYSYLDQGTVDRTPFEFLNSDLGEDYEQFTQELRFTSEPGKAIDYILGIFYQDTDQSTLFDLHIVPDGGNTRHIVTDQEGETYAVFGQLSWHLNERLDLIVEGRYTHEQKEGHQMQQPLDIYTTDPVMGPGSGGTAGVFNLHRVKGGRSENDFSPGVTVEWHPSGERMYYASVKRGFKGGGFDHQLNATQAVAENNFEFDEEVVTAFEMGGKLTLAQGRAQLNIALFYSEFDDLQVSALVPADISFLVTNAASASSQGVELDLKWRLTESLTLSAAMANLDTEFDKFDNAACYQGQTSSQGCRADGTQDLAGRPLQFAPEWSYSISLQHVVILDDQLKLTSFLLAYYVDDQLLALDQDPMTLQEDYIKVDARLTLGDVDDRWEISLVGRNLSDKTTTNFGNDVGSFMGTYFRMVEAPRIFALRGTLRF